MVAKVEPIVLHHVHLHFRHIARNEEGLLGHKALHVNMVVLGEVVAHVTIDASFVLCKAALLLVGQNLTHLLVVAKPMLTLTSLGIIDLEE